MSKYLETLPQYHFDRDDFCKVFGEVFTDDEIIDIDVMCGYPQNTSFSIAGKTSSISFIVTAARLSTGISIWDEPTPVTRKDSPLLI